MAFVEGFGAQNAGYIAPALARAFQLRQTDLGSYFSLGLFGLMLGALLVAPLADRLGRKPVLVGCASIFGLCSLAQSLSPSVALLFTFRFLNLLGIGGAMPNVIATTSEYSPSRSRSLMIIVMFNGFTAGSVAAGLFAARMVQAMGWGSVLIAAGIMPLALVPLLLFLLPESARFLATKEGTQSQIATIVRRIDPNVRAETVFLPEVDSKLGISVAALFHGGRARKTALLWILVFCSLLDLFLLSSWLPTQIASLGISIAIAILIGSLLQVGGMVGMVLGWVMDRLGPHRTLCLSYVIAAVAIACIPAASASVPMLSLAVFAAGFGVIGGQTASNAVAADTYPTEIRATGVGWFLGVGRAGSIVGPLLAGFLLSIGVSNRAIFLMAVAPALVAAFAGLGLGMSTPRPQSVARLQP